MGIEYKIMCDAVAVSRFDEFIRRQPCFESYDAEHRLYHLRFPENANGDDFPEAYAMIEADGIYFCDNLTSKDSAARIFRSLIDHALLYSERITIYEP